MYPLPGPTGGEGRGDDEVKFLGPGIPMGSDIIPQFVFYTLMTTSLDAPAPYTFMCMPKKLFLHGQKWVDHQNVQEVFL